MPLDALCLSGVVHELQNALSGAKIDKIYQPGRDEVVLALRAPAGNVKLLLSASPSHPRAHLTQISRENPYKPPMFCMLLRKHLSGARLLELVQPPMERVVDLRLEALDELGDRVERRLVLEAMGRHSNLILLDGEGRIMDCLRRVDSDMSARRQVLPGLFYRLPPAQEKLDPSSLDRFYEQRENQERVRQRGQDLIRSVTNARDRAARKIGLQEQELAATRDRERLRQFGDIITSNLHAMEKGMSRLTAADFYDPECPQIHIPLDPLLTPQQNAAKYYKEYNKAKTAESILTLQLEKGRRDLDYLNSVLEAIALAEGERDLQEIRQELTDTGYLRRPSKARDRGKRVASKPMEFRSSSGLRISVGKNNTQNDLLTTKQAFKSDLWFHTQKIHGSHVILWTEGGQPDLTSIQEAAQLAAWFSQGRASGKVAVDYTPVKYVKKPGGARPGMVVYTTYETAYVAPDGELARRLRVK